MTSFEYFRKENYVPWMHLVSSWGDPENYWGDKAIIEYKGMERDVYLSWIEGCSCETFIGNLYCKFLQEIYHRFTEIIKLFDFERKNVYYN